MFAGFANVWTPAVFARALRRRPLAITLAGEALVLFRDGGGAPRALIDRCPHRGVALSLGKVTDDGCLECPFHAWRFDGSGAVTHVPLNPDAKRERLFARSLPTRERGGLVWVYTSCTQTPEQEPSVPDALLDETLARTELEVTWRTHWTRAMENMLDSPHVPFVHAATIGRGSRKRLTKDSRMEVTWADRPHGGQIVAALDGEDGGATLDFYMPNMMALHIPIPGKVFRMHALCVPVDERTTRLMVVGTRSFMKPRVLNWLFNRANQRIAEEDRAIVESSFPLEVPRPGQELSVATDRPTLRFRKYYFEHLASSGTSTSSDDQLKPAG